MKTTRKTRTTLLTVLSAFIWTLNALAQPANEPGSGNCLSFDGVSDYVDCGSGINIANQSFTFEAWVKRTNINWSNYIIGQGSGGTNAGMHWGFRGNCQNCPGDYYWFGFYNNDMGTTGSYTTDKKWHHFSATYNATTNVRTMYVDGVLVGQNTSPSDYIGTGLLYLGKTTWAGGNHFGGPLDEVRIWNYARSQTEIREDMCKKLTGNEPGLVGYWHFDEGSGNTAFDSSPNNNDGTLQ